MPVATGVRSLSQRRVASNQTVKQVTAATTLAAQDTLVYATIPAASSYTITLPPLAECVGEIFFIFVKATSGGTSVIVNDQGDGIQAYTPAGTYTAVGDFTIIMNVGGLCWIELKEVST